MFAFWKPLLTECFIQSIKADDGLLVDLASNEMRSFFDWKRVEREVTVIKPDFLMNKNGVVKNVTIYAKMLMWKTRSTPSPPHRLAPAP